MQMPARQQSEQVPRSFGKWPEVVTSEDFQVQALERELLREQEKHLEHRLVMMEKLIRPRPVDDQGHWIEDADQQFPYAFFPNEVKDPNYSHAYHSFYIQKDKVPAREHQLAEFYRRLDHHPIIYSLAGIKEIARQDFIESATQRSWLESEARH